MTCGGPSRSPFTHHEGLRDDLPRYLNQDLLLRLRPVLRALVGPVPRL